MASLLTSLVKVFSYEGGRFLEASGSTQKDLRIKQLRECLEGILRPLHMEQYVEHFLQSDLSMDMLPQVIAHAMAAFHA